MDKIITFTTTGGEDLDSVITDVNGKFTVTGIASDEVGGWDVNASFAGDADYNSSSDVKTYKTTPIRINAPPITVQQVANEGFLERTMVALRGITLPIQVPEIEHCDYKVIEKSGDIRMKFQCKTEIR